jgi:hypothetical protein
MLGKYFGVVVIMAVNMSISVGAPLATGSGTTVVSAQTSKKKPGKQSGSQSADDAATDALAKARQDMIAAAQEYRASLDKLLPFQEAQQKAAADTFEKRKSLYSQGIVSKRELEESERALAAAQSKLDQTHSQIADADGLVAEAIASDQLVKQIPSGTYQTTAALIRYNGTSAWSLKDASKIETYYQSAFGRSLPISAFGQTPVHDKLGFDHHDAMDVAVQPDSAEGQALMAYLRGQGIPFIAFRHAVAGSATGAHIHIGRPSHRTAGVPDAPPRPDH